MMMYQDFATDEELSGRFSARIYTPSYRINCVEEEEEISSLYITIEKSKRDHQRRERRKKEDREKGNEKGESKVFQSEGSLTSLLEEANAETLKEILIQHSKDYRSSMLSCVEGNIQLTLFSH